MDGKIEILKNAIFHRLKYLNKIDTKDLSYFNKQLFYLNINGEKII